MINDQCNIKLENYFYEVLIFKKRFLGPIREKKKMGLSTTHLHDNVSFSRLTSLISLFKRNRGKIIYE